MNIPVGTSYVWMCSQLLWQMLGPKRYSTVWDSWKGDGLRKLLDLDAQKALKEIETAVRRTGRWLDGHALEPSTMGHIVNANLFVGRARLCVVWGPEVNNRCDTDYKLRYYDRERRRTDVMLSKLYKVVSKHLTGITEHLQLTYYSWQTFCSSAHNRVASGSMSECRIAYDSGVERPINADAGKRTLYSYLGRGAVVKFLDMKPSHWFSQ